MERQNFRIPAWDNFSRRYEEKKTPKSPRFKVTDLFRTQESLRVNQRECNNTTVQPSGQMSRFSPLSMEENKMESTQNLPDLSGSNGEPNTNLAMVSQNRTGRKQQLKSLRRTILKKKATKRMNRVKSLDQKDVESKQNVTASVLKAHKDVIKTLMKVFSSLNKYSLQTSRMPDSFDFMKKFELEILRLQEFKKKYLSPMNPFANAPDMVERFIRNFYALKSLQSKKGPFEYFFVRRCDDPDCFSKDNIGKLCLHAHGNQKIRKNCGSIPFNEIFQTFKTRLSKAQKYIDDLKKDIKTNAELSNLVKKLKNKLRELKIQKALNTSLKGDEVAQAIEENKEISIEVQERLKKHEDQRAKPKFYPPSIIIKESLEHCDHCCLGDKQKCFLERYFHKYYNLLEALEKLLVCPITLEMIKKPTIIPSGNLVEKRVVQRLIRDGKADPFNRRLRLEKVIPDRFANAVLDLFINNLQF
ncbi:unnamed protein product [Moneuplotes crassus]|uniref:U-box domain-containing protein n=1 Tax=Euplotes crassus TaxID=5936 RepID=A0AAD1Y3S5_EUPCR|nr:unnamed protein product [Moneuplotes crassus]